MEEDSGVEDEEDQTFNEICDSSQQFMNEGVKFKNKFNDREDDHAEILFKHKTQNNNFKNPIHYMHQVHQTEEDQENPEFIDKEIEINNFFNFNEDKANLLEALQEYSGVKNPSRLFKKNISKYVK